ncbi:class I SAM-dependent methyltransferase [Microtetraspora niveoalba]|uniref:class I SAM-dependent methyltransferase n=1 Tax=Microtetraspora niveoalba TaxID=46175 RepID=UPI00082D8C0D|nr:50S ribosomal protein L11 methyltransferase [Microtetraspora niveoalba]
MEDLVREHTRLVAVPYVPEIRLHLAPDEEQDAVFGLWERTGGLPYWAYAWAGGQALARHVLDHPELVRGRTVLDLASGSGLVAVAAAMAGAARVVANDVDPHAMAAIVLNARANGAAVTVRRGDILATTPREDVVLAGDAFYDAPLTERVMPFLLRARPAAGTGAAGRTVLVGDPERACSYLPRHLFAPASVHLVPAALEDVPYKRTTVWRLM